MTTTWSKHILDNGAVETHYQLVVHTFKVANVEDPEVYAAQPLWEWQQSEPGQWIMKHAIELPTWQKMMDYEQYEYKFAVIAKLRDKDYTFWQLKFNK